MSPTLRRYAILQLPGIAIAATVAMLLWRGGVVSETVAVVGFVAWLVKDVVFYPFVRTAYEPTIAAGADRLVGETGSAATRLAPSGQVRIRGELWNARAGEGAAIDAGRNVTVIATDGLTLVVREPDSVSPAPV